VQRLAIVMSSKTSIAALCRAVVNIHLAEPSPFHPLNPFVPLSYPPPQVTGGIEIILSLLDPNPVNRPALDTAPSADLLKAPFFKGFAWPALLQGTMFPPFVPPPVRPTGKPIPVVIIPQM
jgi:hypothetical protein